jgi:hypothetical protein
MLKVMKDKVVPKQKIPPSPLCQRGGIQNKLKNNQ